MYGKKLKGWLTELQKHLRFYANTVDINYT